MKAKTIMMMVLCPYCGTGYTFRNPAKRAEFMPDSTTPLHPTCQASAANAQRVRGFIAGGLKKAGYTVQSFKPEGGERTYRIAQ